MRIGYARVSTNRQDLAAQISGLKKLGCEKDNIYVDHGRSGRNRNRDGLRLALAACRAGDEFVVTKMDRFARSLRDAADIASDMFDKGVALNIGGVIYNPNDPIGKMLFTMLALFAEFELDLIQARTREGLDIAREKGRLKGGKPKLTNAQQKHLAELYEFGTFSIGELGDLFNISRATVYRILERHGM